MVKKVFRTGSIRKLTPKERAHLAPSGELVDVSVPMKARKKLHISPYKFDRDAMEEKLGVALGRYREQSSTQEMQPAQQVKIANECLELMAELRARLAHLPPAVLATAEAVAWKTKADSFASITAKLQAELSATDAILRPAVAAAKRWKSKPGKKPATPRAEFIRAMQVAFRDLAPPLEGERLARLFIYQMLRACDVPIPKAERECDRLIRRVVESPST